MRTRIWFIYCLSQKTNTNLFYVGAPFMILQTPQIHRTALTRSELFCFLKPNWIHLPNVGMDSPRQRRKVRRIWERPDRSAQRRATPGRSDMFPDWFPEALSPQPANRPYQGANPDGPSSSHSKHGNSYKMTKSQEEGRVKAGYKSLFWKVRCVCVPQHWSTCKSKCCRLLIVSL